MRLIKAGRKGKHFLQVYFDICLYTVKGYTISNMQDIAVDCLNYRSNSPYARTSTTAFIIDVEFNQDKMYRPLVESFLYHVDDMHSTVKNPNLLNEPHHITQGAVTCMRTD